MTLRDLPFVAAIAFVGSAIPLLLIVGVVQARFLLRIRRCEPALWERLGRPAAFVGLSSNPLTASARVNKFFYDNDLAEICDVSVRRLVQQVRLIRRVFLYYVIGVGGVLGSIMLLLQWRVI